MADPTLVYTYELERPCISGAEDLGESYTAGTESWRLIKVGNKIYKLYCYVLCPYSLEWRQRHTTTNALTGDEVALDGYYSTTTIENGHKVRRQYKVTSDKQTWHTTTSGHMAFHMRGPKAGFLCLDDACYYHTSVTPGERLFIV